MASPESSLLCGHIHIAPCERESHMKWMHDLEKAFEAKGLKCVVVYKPYDKISRWFAEAFNNCQFTIVHRCRSLLNTIESCQGLISENSDKVMVVDFGFRGKKKGDDAIYSFLNEYSKNVIKDEKDLQAFVKKAVNIFKEFNPTSNEMEQIPSVVSQDENQRQLGQVRSEVSLSQSDESQIELGCLKKYPDMFGETGSSNLLVTESCFVLKDEPKYDDSKHLYELCSSKESYLMADLQLLILKVIPKKYKERKALDLVILALWNDDNVGKRAAIMLELLLLTTPHQKFSHNVYIIIETILYEALCEIRDEKKTMTKPRVKQLSYLYIITICEWISNCQDKSQMNICDMHMSTSVGVRSMPKNASAVIEKSFTHLDSFLAEFKSDWKCNNWKTQVDKLFKFQMNGAEPVKEREKSVGVSLLFAYQCLKKTLLSKDKDNLEHFKKVFGALRSPKTMDKTPLISQIFIHGLTLLLTLALKGIDHQEGLQELCKTGMEIINNFSTNEERLDDIQPMLMFHRNQNIRSLAFLETYKQDQIQLLQGELERLLCPLLQGPLVMIDNIEMEKAKKLDWHQLTGSFNCKKVVIRIHMPQEDDHRKRNKSFFNPHQDVNYNELLQLQNLNHKNIIQLLAIGNGIPYFYILEDFMSTNLQKALKHKILNSNPFAPHILLRFVLDALTGLQYCHDRGFVHRNLTAESLFIVDENFVKLCGFHLCTKLHNESSKPDDKTEKYIPSRWAAPESLREFVYTKASDMWMVGHLINEVFTHGSLPYKFLDSDELAVKHIIKGKGFITREPTVPEPLHKHIIAACNSYKIEDRPTVGKVLTLLQQSLGFADMKDVDFSDIDDNFKASADHEKGVPETITIPQFIEDQDQMSDLGAEFVALSDITIKLKFDKEHIFRTKLERRFTPEIMARIDELTDILGHIKIVQSRQLAHHYELTIPSSNKGNLLDLTLKRSLGDKLEPYIQCLVQVGNTLDKLWAKSWIIGDFCGSDVYVDQENDAFKVYIISLTCLNLLPAGESYIVAKENVLKDAQEVFRAAPEVLKHAMFSPASDTYCFGHLIWEILTAFDNPKMKRDDFKQKLQSNGFRSCPKKDIYNFWVEKYYKEKVQTKLEERLTKPKCCSEDFYQFIKECLHVTDSKRLMKSLVDRLNECALDI